MKALSFFANWLLSRPFYASLDITNYCNLRCEGCDFPLLVGQKRLGEDLSLQDIEARIEALHEAFGSLTVVLAGFEPTIRRDLTDIIAAASKHNYVGIVTNGTLIDREKAEGYWKAGLLFASVSMPAMDDKQFKEIVQVQTYGVNDAKRALETLVETAPRFRRVIITTTIDNQTTPAEMGRIALYAKQVGGFVSFQPYSTSKPASAIVGYDASTDRRAIRIETLETVFGGSLTDAIIELKRKYGNVIGRKKVLKNLDVFIREGTIPFKPRGLKIYTNGEIGLYPESATFSNIDTRIPRQVWRDYREHVAALRVRGPLRAPNCYRCTNLTNPSTPMGDLFGYVARSFARSS